MAKKNNIRKPIFDHLIEARNELILMCLGKDFEYSQKEVAFIFNRSEQLIGVIAKQSRIKK